MDTYPTKREVGNIIDSNMPIFGEYGYVSSLEGMAGYGLRTIFHTFATKKKHVHQLVILSQKRTVHQLVILVLVATCDVKTRKIGDNYLECRPINWFKISALNNIIDEIRL